jgi:PAS domain S-box-containing protein
VQQESSERLGKRSEASSVTPEMPDVGLLAASPDCVKLIDLQGHIRFINENGRCLLEFDDGSHCEGLRWIELWPQESRGLVEHAMHSALAGEVGRFSGVCPTAKGTSRSWSVAVSPVYDKFGSMTWLLAVSRDVTQVKSFEQALRSGDLRFRALADNIAQFAWMADPSGNIFWYNQRWFDYTGTTFEQMKGWGWTKVHHPQHVDRVVEKITECFKEGRVWEDTFPLRAADGSYRWFLSRAMPIHGEDGSITLWCGTNTDITEQRKSSQKLGQLARLIELSHEAIIVRSLADGILLWNRGCEELYGYSQDEALGKDSHQLLKTANALTGAALENLLQTEGTWSGELVRTAKDGTKVYVDCRKQVIRLDGHYVILETDRDITDRRRADELRNVLVGELNHRVKNTLAIVQSLASQTARNSTSIDEFLARFTGRLQSLSGAHNVLTEENWSGATLKELIKTQIDVISGITPRFEFRGPDVRLPTQAAQQLALILHELATNAVKHGALSGSRGKVLLEWKILSDPKRQLRLTWTEIGGPTVELPTSRGFGLSIIERSGRLPHLDSKVAFEKAGVVCTIDLQLDETPDGEVSYFNPSKTASLRN